MLSRQGLSIEKFEQRLLEEECKNLRLGSSCQICDMLYSWCKEGNGSRHTAHSTSSTTEPGCFISKSWSGLHKPSSDYWFTTKFFTEIVLKKEGSKILFFLANNWRNVTNVNICLYFFFVNHILYMIDRVESWVGLLHWLKKKRNILGTEKWRNANRIGHILRRNCVLISTTGRNIEGTGRWCRRCRQLLVDLKKNRRYLNLKEEPLYRPPWRTRSGRGYRPVVKQTM
jgi:hypothetical protein